MTPLIGLQITGCPFFYLHYFLGCCCYYRAYYWWDTIFRKMSSNICECFKYHCSRPAINLKKTSELEPEFVSVLLGLQMSWTASEHISPFWAHGYMQFPKYTK